VEKNKKSKMVLLAPLGGLLCEPDFEEIVNFAYENKIEIVS